MRTDDEEAMRPTSFSDVSVQRHVIRSPGSMSTRPPGHQTRPTATDQDEDQQTTRTRTGPATRRRRTTTSTISSSRTTINDQQQATSSSNDRTKDDARGDDATDSRTRTDEELRMEEGSRHVQDHVQDASTFTLPIMLTLPPPGHQVTRTPTRPPGHQATRPPVATRSPPVRPPPIMLPMLTMLAYDASTRSPGSSCYDATSTDATSVTLQDQLRRHRRSKRPPRHRCRHQLPTYLDHVDPTSATDVTLRRHHVTSRHPGRYATTLRRHQATRSPPGRHQVATTFSYH